MVKHNWKVKIYRVFHIWNQCRSGIANNFYLTWPTKTKAVKHHNLLRNSELKTSWESEKKKKKTRVSCTGLSKTLQGEELICPVTSRAETSKSGLVTNWLKAKGADNGILHPVGLLLEHNRFAEGKSKPQLEWSLNSRSKWNISLKSIDASSLRCPTVRLYCAQPLLQNSVC